MSVIHACGFKKERILLWQDPEEDQEGAALAAAASVEAALAAADLAVAALAVTAALADTTTDIITDISTDIIITITARDFSSSAPGIITTADLAVALQEVALAVFWHIFLPRLLLFFCLHLC